MESSINRRVEKRGFTQSVEDEDGNMPPPKKPKLPALAGVIMEALKLDSMQRLCSSLEPLLRRIVSEEVERALTKLGHAKIAERSSAPRIEGPGGKNLQLLFRTRMPPHLFTGGKVEGEQGAAIRVVLQDLNTDTIVQTGPESTAKLNVVVLEGDFNEDGDDDWTSEHFQSQEVKEREGKRPLLTGDLQMILKDGVGTLGDLTFTDNSSWIRSRKFRLGVKVAPGYCEGIRVREAKTEAFAVKDHRGELYKKHYPPALRDDVWRLDRIAKDGALHKKLLTAEIVTVEDFLRCLVRDPQRLRNILGSGMSNRMWENTVEHAKTCVLGGKLYVYFADDTHSTGAVFNHIYELRGLIADGQFFPLESLTHNQKISVDSLVKRAYENWGQVVEYGGNALNPGTSSINGTRSSANNHHVVDHYFTTAQCRPQQYIASDPTLQCQNDDSQQSIPHLIEFPFVRHDPMNGLSLTDHHGMVPGSTDYRPVEASTDGDSYISAGDYSQPRGGQGLEDFYSEEIRLRSSQMLDSDDMQRLLMTVGMGVGVGMGHAFGHSNDASYCYDVPYEPQMDGMAVQDRGRSSGKAVVGWLKLKAALRWGIFIRKKAAERRAQLVELD
ncbi:calmodulin-binding protein 60 E-like [Malania oleifera]|uniref:calmodulin-binding protein 60 E-like n=1 Tax=Malania oleifera TaxID=397392 RepID=UPI0025AEB3EB|nr:calmodulin-binding protein 60 E-like [Malania oleifera]